jgi:hypothetical protein
MLTDRNADMVVSSTITGTILGLVCKDLETSLVLPCEGVQYTKPVRATVGDQDPLRYTAFQISNRY